MTSRNLFFKRMKQDLEQRIWLPVVFFIICFLTLELPLFSIIENYQNRSNFMERMQEYLLDSFFSAAGVAVVLTIGMAVISAMSGFIYIHSAKKLDVYHSIPIRREALFVQQYVYGVLYYLVPMVLHVLICIGICAVQGVLNGAVLGQALGFLLVQLLLYLAHYSVVVTAVCLTGNLVISILGSAVLLTYSAILSLLKSALMDQFFMTYYGDTAWEGIWAFSPMHLYANMLIAMEESTAEHLVYTQYFGYYILLFLMAAVYTAFALFLYKKRPTEAANNSIAFSVTEPVIKVMVVAPVSVLAGFFFMSISYDYGFGWFLFGCIFGFILCCPLMEIIFRKDVKAVFKHPLQIGINGAIVIALILVFKLDVFGYDAYIPAENKVESYAISFGGQSSIYPVHGNAFDYRMDNMTIMNNESTRKLLEHGVEITRGARTGLYDNVSEDSERFYTSMLVKYCLKDGREIYRNYLLNQADEQVVQWLADTYNDTQYKLGIYPVLAEDEAITYKGVRIRGTYASDELPLSEEKMQRFIEAYRQELTNLTFEEIQTEYPVAEMELAVSTEELQEMMLYTDVVVEETRNAEDLLGNCAWEGDYKIYPSFTQTLALLEEYGVDLGRELQVEDVISVYIEDYSEEVNDDDGYYDKLYITEYTAEAGQTEQIAQILAGIRSNNLEREFDIGEGDVNYINVRMDYYYDNKQYEYEHFSFKKDMIPEFVWQDLKPVED